MTTYSESFPIHLAEQRPVFGGRERRRAPRKTFIAQAMLCTQRLPSANRPVFISNISTLGVGFHTRVPLPVGWLYQLRLHAGPLKWSARVRVVSCRPNPDGSYDIGGEFVGQDPAIHVGEAVMAA